MSKSNTDRFLLISRVDYPGEGARAGQWKLASEICEQEDADGVIVAGGLFAHRAINARIKSEQKISNDELRTLRSENAALSKNEKEDLPTLAQNSSAIREKVLDDIVQEMADMLPVFRNKRGKQLKIYVTLAPRPHNYDGPLGREAAERLQKLRSDVLLWDNESSRFEMKKSGKVLWVLNPEKTAWRSKYYSTAADRLVEDKEKQTSQKLPDLWVVGCVGSALNNPAGGENPVPMITVPMLHRPQQVNTSENQVGVAIVELSADSDFPITRIYDFKDLVAKEREFIPVPKGLEDEEGLSKSESSRRERQRAILGEIIRHPITIGMLEDALPWKRRTLERDINHYNKQGFEPAIILDEKNGKYNVSYEWLQKKLEYPLPSVKRLNEDSLLAFCCLHAGYNNTQYAWFIRRVAQLILKHDIRNLVSCGDFLAGLKHNLALRGEIYPGFSSYTAQEELAAEVTGAPIVEVFKERFDECLNRKRKKPSNKLIGKMIDEALVVFRFWRGNHDEWVQDDGHEPLATFRKHLHQYVSDGIRSHLNERGLEFVGVTEIVREHLIYNNEHTLPSGVTMSIRHPHQGRMQTSSGRAQQTLAATSGQILALGNFHVHSGGHEWRPQSGQRLAMQLGTITSGTDFEDNMNKKVDTGVGMAKVYSNPDTGRIFITEIIWDSPSEAEMVVLDSTEVVNRFTETLGV